MKFSTTFTLATLALALIGSTEATNLRGLRSLEDTDPDYGSNGLDACEKIGNGNEQACEGRKECYWYPHGSFDEVIGTCSTLAGVSCGQHRATDCDQCQYYDTVDHGEAYCNGDCKWKNFWLGSYCTDA